jgi:hypothetical protein
MKIQVSLKTMISMLPIKQKNLLTKKAVKIKIDKVKEKKKTITKMEIIIKIK